MLFKRLFVNLTVISLLVSCVPKGKNSIFDGANFDDEIDFSVFEEYLDPDKPIKDEESDQNEKSDIELPSMLSIPGTEKLINSGKLITLSVTEDVSIKDVLLEVSRLAEVDIEMDSGISGGIILQVENKPFSVVIDRIANMANLRYHIESGILHIERDLPYIKHYQLSMLNIVRKASNKMRITTNSAVDGKGAVSSGATTSITSFANGDVLEDIRKSVKSILRLDNEREDDTSDFSKDNSTSDGLISLNNQSSILTVKQPMHNICRLVII